MKRRHFLIWLSLLIVITVAGTAVHGRFTNRWGYATAQRELAAERLQLAPLSFGNWLLENEKEFSDRVKGILNCTGSWSRVYRHRTTGQLVNVAMIVGPPGPTSSHVAEMCYSTAGYDLVGERTVFQLNIPGDRQHEFADTRFVASDVSGQELQVCFAWRQTDRWLAPRIPRVVFGGGSFLYKLQAASYFMSDVASEAEEEQSVCRAFLTEFVPALEGTVFNGAAP